VLFVAVGKFPPPPLSFFSFFLLSFYRSITNTSPQTHKDTHTNTVQYILLHQTKVPQQVWTLLLQLTPAPQLSERQRQRQRQRECEWISSYSQDFQRDSVGSVLQPQQIKQNQSRVAEIKSVSKSSGWELSLLFWFLLTYISLLFNSAVVVVVVTYLSGLFGSLSLVVVVEEQPVVLF